LRRRQTRPAAAREPHGAGAERDTRQHQHQTAHRRRRDRLAEEDGAVAERERRHEVRHEDRARRARAGEERVVEDVREPGPAEPDEQAREPHAAHALAAAEAEGEERREERRRGLDHRGQAGVDVLLGPGDRDDRDRRVDEAGGDERAGRGAELPHGLAAAEADERERQERERADPEADADERRRRELADADLDEHEARAPDRREREQHHDLAAAHPGCNAARVPRILAVDWSGARAGERRAIWLAEAAGGRLTRLSGGWSREEVVAHLLEEAERDPDLVAGLDFAFSLPEWFLRARGIDDVWNAWDLVACEAEAWLRDPQPPFWRERKPPGEGSRLPQ